MKVIIASAFALAIIAAVGWYGYELFIRDGNNAELVQNLGKVFANEKHEKKEELLKCITKEGHVIYGTVPEGIRCEKIVPTDGSLTVVPSLVLAEKVSGRSAGKENEQVPVYRCDGRIYCSQMSSCEEAKFFLKNCPNVKMDGNHDGIPCEQQWCN